MAKNNVVKAVLLLCVMMQVLAMTPHHHHADSERVCVNFTHLSQAHNHDVADLAGTANAADLEGVADFVAHCDACCGDAHDHDNDPFAVCTVHNIVLSEPVRERGEVETIQASVPDDCHCGYCDDAIDHINAAMLASLSNVAEMAVRHDAQPPIIRYIAKALSPRAPDFIA